MQAAQIRYYQQDSEDHIYRNWSFGSKDRLINTLEVLPTGAGKTFIFSRIISDHPGRSIAIAHRRELVIQISMALAANGVRHRIFAPDKLVKLIIQMHIEEYKECYHDPTSQTAVASVDTVSARKGILRDWLAGVTLWVQDEAHHILRDNKWGKVLALMPLAKGLGVTATPLRADGRGLGRLADGVFDVMHVGATMREIINEGYLTDYRVICSTSDLDLRNIDVSAKTGDYVQPQLRVAVKKSTIVGDVVKEYLKHAAGRLGVTFAPDVETAQNIANAYNAAGVPAECISHETTDEVRVEVLKRFKARKILQLVNVDLFGEGFDLPAIEIVSFARPTMSYSLFVQQFGRALRLMIDNPELFDMNTRAGRLAAIAASKKSVAIIIDHVGNVMSSSGIVKHGLPDAARPWTLDRSETTPRGNSDADVIPLRCCLDCANPYPRILDACPFCGKVHKPKSRKGPEKVDGDLTELDADVLARLRKAVEASNPTEEDFKLSLLERHVPKVGHVPQIKAFRKLQANREALKHLMAWWAGTQRAKGYGDSEIHRLFYWRFGVDFLTAQTLDKVQTSAAIDAINQHLMEGAL